MSLTSSFLAALIPMAIYLIILWRMDKYDWEPLMFVVSHFMWGAVGAVTLGILGSYMLDGLGSLLKFPHESSPLLQAILIAPFVEEISKALLLFYTVRSRKFDNLTDGLVYGGAIGLGFGMTENFLYFSAFGSTVSIWITLVFIRSLFSAVMHMISTGILGAMLGSAKFSRTRFRFYYPFAGLTFAILIHFTWNLSVSFQSTFMFGMIFMSLLILMFFFIFRYAIQQERELIQNELYEEFLANIIPEKYIRILSSHLRLRKGWIDESIRKAYIRSSISLAFRKNEYKNSTGSDRLYYEQEIQKLREMLIGFNSIPDANGTVLNER